MGELDSFNLNLMSDLEQNFAIKELISAASESAYNAYFPSINSELYRNQPIGITSPVKKAGKVVSTFKSGQWAAGTGSPTLTQGFTGYDVNGNVTGITGRTQPEMLLVEPTVNTTSRIVLNTPSTNIFTPNLNGKFGLWVYVDLP